jgi:S-adenosylmethionine hydrolase
VIKRISPEVEVIDITHGIAPTNVLQGALVLANTLPYMPEGVHLAVVDPGVGGERKPLALRGGDGRLYVGPDNGLLLVAAERLGGVDAAVELADPAYRLDPVARTFHGRDVFAPAAAHLAAGLELEALGPAVRVAELVRLEVPAPKVGTRRLRATVVRTDRFGNVQLNLTSADLESVGIGPGPQVEVAVGFERYFAVVAATFAEVRRGDIVLYEDAYRSISLAINQGNAAEMFGVVLGQELELTALP